MSDESESIAAKTWSRAVLSINKVGYMDGAADGQTSAFQPSFDMGYEQGFHFGLDIGFKEAMLRFPSDATLKQKWIDVINENPVLTGTGENDMWTAALTLTATPPPAPRSSRNNNKNQ